MKKELFEISCLVITTLISLITPIVNASAITREYEQDFYELGYRVFSFKIRVVIETELYDMWKLRTPYRIDFIITITYLNETIFHREGFKLHFYKPHLFLVDRIYEPIYEIIKNETDVQIGQIGTLTVRFEQRVHEQRLPLKGFIQYSVYQNNELQFGGNYWNFPEPIWIDIEEETVSTTDYLNPITYICIGIVIVALPIGTYFIYKSRKSKEKKVV